MPEASKDRPVISDYRAIPEYLADMVRWRRQQDPGFSIRKALAAVPGCSPALFTLVLKGERKLTRERVPVVAAALGLKRHEEVFLDRWVQADRSVGDARAKAAPGVPAPERRRSSPCNHLLSDWLHPYVKDLCGLRSSTADPGAIHRALGGIASPARIERSLRFLLANGYLRRTLDGRIVRQELLTQSTDGPPSAKIRKFHKKALQIAQRGIDVYPPERRRASALILSLTDEGADELRELLKEFYERLMAFTEQRSDERGKLYQVVLHLTPIGGFDDEGGSKNDMAPRPGSPGPRGRARRGRTRSG